MIIPVAFAFSKYVVETPSLFKHKSITFDEVIVEEERIGCTEKKANDRYDKIISLQGF